MSALQITILAAVGIYFLAMIAIGIMASRDQDHHGFAIGSRNVGYIPTIGSLASSFRDGMGAVFWFGFGAVTGYGGLWLIIGAVAGLTLYAIIGPKIRAIAAEKNYITVGQMIRDGLGPVTEKITAALILFFCLMYMATQLYVSGNIFAEVLHLQSWIGVCSVAVIVGLYLYFGGYSTVIKTDAIQFFLIISLIVVPFFFAPAKADMLDFGSIFSLDPDDRWALGLIGVFFVLGSADTWQRMFSARNASVIHWSFPLAGVFLGIMTLSLIWLGMAAKPYLGADIDTSTAFFQIFTGGFMSTPLLAFVTVVIMAITMSTLDTYCYLCAATFSKNFLPERLTASRDVYIRYSQIIMMVLMVATSIVALLIADVIKFLFGAASLMYILGPIYLFTGLGWFRRNRRTDILISIAVILSTALYIFMFSRGYFEKTILTLVPVSASIVLYGLVLIYSKMTGNGKNGSTEKTSASK